MTLILDESLQKELEEIQILLGKPYSKLELLKLLATEKLASLKKELSKKTKKKTQVRVREIKNEREKENNQKQARKTETIKLREAAKSKGEGKENDKAKADLQSQTSKFDQLANSQQQRSRYISKSAIREIRIRDQHQCQYLDPVTKRQCSARYHLQTEHMFPFARGGANSTENLQKLCANHNRLRAVQQFGPNKMKIYIPSLR